MTASSFTTDDIAYITANFRPLSTLCRTWGFDQGAVHAEIDAGFLPHATYSFTNGRSFFPDDYFAFGIDISPKRRRTNFIERFKQACHARQLDDASAVAEGVWSDYLVGSYAVCLRLVLPETIVSKIALIAKIEGALVLPEPHSPSWREALEVWVDSLDALLRPFTAYDRVVAGRPLSRDRYVDDVRRRFGLVRGSGALTSADEASSNLIQSHK